MALPHARTIGWREGAICALVPVFIEIATHFTIAHFTIGGARRLGEIFSPDSFMRLVRLRDILAAHRPLHDVARDASGDGTVLHWSHLLDSFLLVLAAPLGLFLPGDAALDVAGVLSGVLELAGLGYASTWAVAPFVGVRWRWLASLSMIAAPAVWSYGQIGMVLHHIPIVIVAVMSWGWAARLIAGYPGGIALGAWVAAGLWLTPETLPLSVLGCGAVFVSWVQRGGRGLAAALRAAGITMLLVTVAAFLVDPPASGYGAVEVDRLSIVFVGVAIVFAFLGCAIVATERQARNWYTRLTVAALVGLVLSGFWLLCFPALLNGPDALMTDAERHAFFDNITEMLPLATVKKMLQFFVVAGLAILFLVAMSVRYRAAVFVFAAAAVITLVALGGAHARFAPYAEAAGALAVPAAIQAVTRRWLIPCVGVVPLVLAIPFLITVVRYKQEAQAAPSCEVTGLTDMLTPFGDAIVLSDVGYAPELLYRTRLRTVGSLYHRNPKAFLRQRAAWRSHLDNNETNAVPPPEVLATGATVLIFCPKITRSSVVRDLPPDTLSDRLNEGQIPRWLHEVGRDPSSGNIVYRVTP